MREGRTIIGEETVKLDAFFSGKRYENPIFYAYSNIDSHSKDTAFEDSHVNDWCCGAGLWRVNFSVPVPMGAIIPKDFHGLLTAGRCLSVDHNIASCIRMKSDMEKCGEAAATLAYIAIKNNISAKDADYSELSKMLMKTGCLDSDHDVGFVKPSNGRMKKFSFITDIDEIKSELSTDFPNIAIWSAKLLGIKEQLREWLNEENDDLKRHSAIALGLLSETDGLAILRSLAAERDIHVPAKNEQIAYALCVTAVYLLGRLKDQDAVSILSDIIKDGGAFKETDFEPDMLYKEVSDIKFHLFSYAVAAILEIRKAHPELKEKIDKVLNDYILNKEQKMNVSLKFDLLNQYDMYPKIKKYILKSI